jgi:magnesium-transporting ATPase (P-type)
LYGGIICLVSLIWINVASYKTNNLYLLWIPFAFIVFVAIITGYNAEDIFIFKKENGLWKGSFSLSYFASAAIVIFAAITTGINYFILKRMLK